MANKDNINLWITPELALRHLEARGPIHKTILGKS